MFTIAAASGNTLAYLRENQAFPPFDGLPGRGASVEPFAWLARRTGVDRWTLQPVDPDPVDVFLGIRANGSWRGLWASGFVRVLGRFDPVKGLFST